MDKQKLIQALAETGEDQLLLAKVYDKLSSGERKNIPGYTCFLTGREQELAKMLTQRAGIPNVHFYGGPEGAERKILCYIPEYYEPEEFLSGEDSPLCALRAEISAYDSLSHRDFLGGILGLGLKREVLGDIYVSEDHCDFLVLREIAPYILEQLCAIGRARVHVSEIPLSEIHVPQQRVKTIADTVASLRLDSVMASGFQMGRSKAQSYISAGKTEVNHTLVTKADRVIQEGDIISARGLGKLKVVTVKGLTKKGRTGVVLEKYL